ncbi:hypothetical protein L1785_11235 [Antribacter sp. KLBMP9083]|uniref:Uncharacterized protein n=1 Tax=Antribacter soli TaxID=2910976 RepID=A0AA41QDP2_9MICO|nr:hypothetical protein [Antribacter soli]MCF4121555.1 hypothetical protein [Antribacter soli]
MSDTNAAGPAPDPQQPTGGDTPEQAPATPPATPAPSAEPSSGERPVPQYGQYAPPGEPPAYGTPGPSPYGPPAAPQVPPAWNTASEQPVSIGSALGYAFSAFGRSWGVWVVMTLLTVIASAVAVIVTSPGLMESFQMAMDLERAATGAAVDVPATTPGSVVLGAVGAALLTFLSIFLYQGALVATRNGTVGFGDFFTVRSWPAVAVFAAVQVVLSLLGIVPVLGFVVQLAALVALVWAPFAVLEGADGVTAIRSAVGLARANLGLAVLAVLVLFVLTVAGVLACFVGTLVALPVVILMNAYLYGRLTGGQPV